MTRIGTGRGFPCRYQPPWSFLKEPCRGPVPEPGQGAAHRNGLWLTDLDQFLLTPVGESVAEALRGLLREPSLAPVMVVATLWSGHWDAPRARQLLTQQCRQVHVPGKSSVVFLQSLTSAADPRLAEAARLAGDGGEVTPTLADGPCLTSKYLPTGQESE